MIVRCFDRQDERNLRNGTVAANKGELLEFLESFGARAPFFCELVGDNGFNLLLGIGPVGCAQYSSGNGSLPYLMARGAAPGCEEVHIEFLIGNTLTPVPARYGLPLDLVKGIAVAFLETGKPSSAVSWEEV